MSTRKKGTRVFQPPNNSIQAREPQRTIVAHSQELRIAPLPKPEELAEYDRVVPGLGERIVAMAEANGKDRRANNRAIRWATILGQIFAFITVMTALIGGFVLINHGKDVAGVSAIITAIGAPL